MRTYFWKNELVYLMTWTPSYQDYLPEQPDDDDICLMIHNNDGACVGYVIINWMNERGGSTGCYEDYYLCNGLKFRGMTVDDYLINNQIVYDSQVCRWYDDDVKLPGLTGQVDEFARNHVNYQLADARLEFAIEDEGKYIGCVNLCGIESEHDRVSASIYLRSDCRSKGYGTRAMQFALSYAAKELSCHNVIVCVSDGNIASAKMMRKLGLKVSGVQREAAFVGGRYIDTIFFEN